MLLFLKLFLYSVYYGLICNFITVMPLPNKFKHLYHRPSVLKPLPGAVWLQAQYLRCAVKIKRAWLQFTTILFFYDPPSIWAVDQLEEPYWAKCLMPRALQRQNMKWCFTVQFSFYRGCFNAIIAPFIFSVSHKDNSSLADAHITSSSTKLAEIMGQGYTNRWAVCWCSLRSSAVQRPSLMVFFYLKPGGVH